MKKALLVGINYYVHCSGLFGCVDDAYSMKSVLERNGDGTVNFDVQIVTGTGPTDTVNRTDFKQLIRELFKTDCEIALFYFAGHGHIENTGGYLVTSDSKTGDDGISLSDILVYANDSKAKNKIIILDSCHSGIAGKNMINKSTSDLSEGLTILTASSEDQYAKEENGAGVFTSLFVDALNGSAANLLGDITPGSVYAHIDQSLGAWNQRPIFKTNVKNFVPLRKVQPSISISEIQKITEFFPTPGHIFPLNPSYEPDSPNPDPINTQIFSILQKYNRVNLLIPVETPHMYYAAMESKGCKLTVLGEHYRKLVKNNRI